MLGNSKHTQAILKLHSIVWLKISKHEMEEISYTWDLEQQTPQSSQRWERGSGLQERGANTLLLDTNEYRKDLQWSISMTIVKRGQTL